MKPEQTADDQAEKMATAMYEFVVAFQEAVLLWTELFDDREASIDFVETFCAVGERGRDEVASRLGVSGDTLIGTFNSLVRAALSEVCAKYDCGLDELLGDGCTIDGIAREVLAADPGFVSRAKRSVLGPLLGCSECENEVFGTSADSTEAHSSVILGEAPCRGSAESDAQSGSEQESAGSQGGGSPTEPNKLDAAVDSDPMLGLLCDEPAWGQGECFELGLPVLPAVSRGAQSASSPPYFAGSSDRRSDDTLA